MKSLSLTYRFMAGFLATLILLTSLGINLDTHICQGKLKSFNLFGKAKNCYELVGKQNDTSCSTIKYQTRTEGCSIYKKACCNDVFHHFKADINQQVQTNSFDFNIDLSNFVIDRYVLFTITDGFFPSSITIDRYKPPIILRDISVLIQSFLI